MALERWVDSNAKKTGIQFKLLDDGDSANVIFLYRSIEDVLRGGVHYLKSNTYTGDVFCLGAGCPACARGIRLKNKLFVPLFNLSTNRFEIWYLNESFMSVLRTAVFRICPNPSEIVFQITRHGEHGDPSTRYDITAVGKNGSHPYEKIIADYNINIEEAIDGICKEFDSAAMTTMINEYDASYSNRKASSANNASGNSDNYANLPNYQVTPRGAARDLTDYSVSPDDVEDLPTF